MVATSYREIDALKPRSYVSRRFCNPTQHKLAQRIEARTLPITTDRCTPDGTRISLHDAVVRKADLENAISNPTSRDVYTH